MTSDERIDAIEEHLHTLQAVQADLDEQLKQAHVEQWKTRIDDLGAQVRLTTTAGTDRLKQAEEKLRGVWEHTRVQADDASSTAASVADTMRSGLQSAYAEVREALQESRTKISG